MSAFATAIQNSFGKQGGKKVEYLKQPIDLGLETEEEKEAKIQREREKLIAMLTNWKKSWDARTAKSGEKPSQR